MLIEIMIVIILELILFSALIKIYLSMQRSYQWQNQLHEIQETAQTAISILNAEIHKAGYIGCQQLTSYFPLINYPPYLLSKANRIKGTSHEITVRHMAQPPTVLKETMSNQNILYVGNEIKFSEKDILFISDCKHAEIFQVKKINRVANNLKLTSDQPLSIRFEKNAEVSKFEENKLFVARSKRKDRNGKWINSLFLENINHHKMELVEGIEKIIIRYLIFYNEKLMEVEFDKIQDWSSVRGVVIELNLTQSPFSKTWFSYITLG